MTKWSVYTYVIILYILYIIYTLAELLKPKSIYLYFYSILQLNYKNGYFT